MKKTKPKNSTCFKVSERGIYTKASKCISLNIWKLNLTLHAETGTSMSSNSKQPLWRQKRYQDVWFLIRTRLIIWGLRHCQKKCQKLPLFHLPRLKRSDPCMSRNPFESAATAFSQSENVFMGALPFWMKCTSIGKLLKNIFMLANLTQYDEALMLTTSWYCFLLFIWQEEIYINPHIRSWVGWKAHFQCCSLASFKTSENK